MIFNSITYLVFLSITVCLFWLLPKRPRLWMILLSSLSFYGFWRPEFLLIMIASTATDFFVARRIEMIAEPQRRRQWLMASLGVNLGFLLYFKYLFFVLDNATIALRWFGLDIRSPVLDLILPLGISFYTFQSISYTVDVYRKLIRAERNFILYGCFVTFFPQLVAGPILRARELLHQLETRPVFRLDTFVSGLRRILLGLFLKVVLADHIAPLVDAGFGQPISALSALDVITLAFLFGFQIYFDFAAYSSIAIGSARLMGISFPENFNFPYMATSPREFWRRWHISLSSWIRDYLYLPLMGLKVQDRSVGGLALATQDTGQPQFHSTVVLFVTWAIMGLWHGANWTFMIWGLYHATLIAIYRAVARYTAGLPAPIRRWGGWAITIPILMLGWIPFRAETAALALHMLAKLMSPREWLYLGMRENNYLVSALIFLGMILTYAVHENAAWWIERSQLVKLFTNTILMGIVTALVFVFLRPIRQYIYFQF